MQFLRSAVRRMFFVWMFIGWMFIGWMFIGWMFIMRIRRFQQLPRRQRMFVVRSERHGVARSGRNEPAAGRGSDDR
jgi:hypothetical protein